MAIPINDNFNTRAPKPQDDRYFDPATGKTPWLSEDDVKIGIIGDYRHPGLTVNINGDEWWFYNGVADTDLVLKVGAGGSGLVTADNGLSVINDNKVILGGPLTGDTTISGNHTLSFGGVINPLANVILRTAGQVYLDTPSFNIEFQNSLLVDEGGGFGLRYAANYHDTYTERSLVDKGYVDTLSLGFRPVLSVLAATTEDIILSEEQTIDDIPLVDGDRVLVKDQVDATENGIYIVSGSTWGRAADFVEEGDLVQGMFIPVISGTTNEYTSWMLITPNPISITGGSELSFTLFTKLPYFDGGDGVEITGSGLNKTIAVDIADDAGLTFTLGQLAINETIAGTGLSWDAGVLNVNVSNVAITGDPIDVKLDGGDLVIDEDDILALINYPVTAATNGLQIVGSQVKLGGTITGNTTIVTETHTIGIRADELRLSGVSSVNIDGKIVVETLPDTGDSTDGVLTRNESTGEVRVIPSDSLGERNNRYNVDVVSTTSAIPTSGYTILVNSPSSLITLTLPATPENGQAYKIKDVGGNALTYNITVDGNGKQIDDTSTEVTINTDYGAIELMYSTTRGKWFILSFVN